MPVVYLPSLDACCEAWPTNREADLLPVAGPGLGEPVERVYVCGACSSTLDVARLLETRQSLEEWDSVLAKRQWAGRGQLRRTWISEPGNLFAAWRLPLPPRAWQGLLSVLLGWIFCRSLGELGIAAEVKWPNDLLVNGRKVGGILLEERGEVLLAGVGINLVSAPDDTSLRRDTACLAGVLPLARVTPLGLWLRLVHYGRLRYSTTLSASTPLEFSRSIESVLAFRGQVVHVVDGNRSSIRGVYLGIDPDGGLVLHADGARRTVHAGSLALASDFGDI